MEQVVDKGNFSEGKISSNILKLAMPIMLAEFVQILYNLVDRMFIGHIPEYGTLALTGIGIVFPLITIISAFSNLCSFGGSSICSISRGRKDDEQARMIMENSFTILLIYGAILTLIIYVFNTPIMFALGADESTVAYAKEYGDVYFMGTFFVLIVNGMNSFINLQGYGNMGMLTVLIGAFLNIILDPIFIFVLDMGVRGAAVATVISQFVSSLWVVLFLTSKKPPLRITQLRLDRQYVKQIHKLGMSGFTFRATNSITQAVANTTLRIFGGASGSLYIASMSIINQLREILSLPINAITEGSKPVMSYNYGAKEYDRTVKTICFMFKSCLCANVFLWAVFQLFPTQMIKIFTSDTALIENCVPMLRIYFCVYFMMTFQVSGQNTFVALNKPGFAVFFAVFRKFILILPFTLILPRIGLGASGVFWAEAISQIVGSIAAFSTMYFAIIRKLKKNKPI